MKKTMFLAVAIILSILMASVSYAQDASKAKNVMPGSKMLADKPMMNKCMCMCPMHGMMMKKMMVAAQDGGVVIMMGSKILKYDKDLNLVKEAELKMDIEGMKKMMKECPMCQEMSEHCGMMRGSAEEAEAHAKQPGSM